jgi:hypothetical protein
MQSAAKRMHSNAYFREWSDSDTAHLVETQVLHRCTASRVLSVVYATEKSRENNSRAHPRDDGIVEPTAQMAAHSLPLNPTANRSGSLPVDSEADDEAPTSFSEKRTRDARVGRALRQHASAEPFFQRAAEPVFQFRSVEGGAFVMAGRRLQVEHNCRRPG